MKETGPRSELAIACHPLKPSQRQTFNIERGDGETFMVRGCMILKKIE